MNTNLQMWVRDAIAQRGQELIALLQEAQQALGYVPEDAVELISEELDLHPTQIYGILTFYTQFRLAPPGQHSLRVCQGTACHVMGSEHILSCLQRRLMVEVGSTTEDNRFTLERVACVGCCGMAPVVVLDGTPHGNMSLRSAQALIDRYRYGEGNDGQDAGG